MFLNISSFYLFFHQSDNYIYFIKGKIILTEDVTKKTKATIEVMGKESVLRVTTDILKGEKMVEPLKNMALKRKDIEGPI